jgi:uncharacterized protein YcgI (DUF1989 family)
MDYLRIHDTIINRARSRIYDSSFYHNHHITPVSEDNTSTETVPLTIKEHRIIHFLRYKLGFSVENKKSNTCPGEGWYKGRTLKRKYNKVK